MKILLIGAALFLMAVLLFLSCGKEPPVNPTVTPPPPVITPPVNHPPIARAGTDTTVTLRWCNDNATIELDGSRSTDPDNRIISYSWKTVPIPRGEVISSPAAAKTRVSNLFRGEYAFELTVRDSGNLMARDTVLISVKGAFPNEYNLEVTLNGTYSFHDNVEDCYYGPPCSYYDATIIEATGAFPPLGELKLYFSEYSDTAASRYAPESYISLGKHDNSDTYIYGSTTVVLKRLIQQGGGPFSGTLTVTGGSAEGCIQGAYQNLPPLTITGNLDTTTKKTTLTIKGKAYF